MKLPLPQFKVNELYVAEQAGSVTQPCSVKFVICKQLDPVMLRPDDSERAYSVDHFNWVIDRPKNNV